MQKKYEMEERSWSDVWQSAFDRASFYESEQNTKAYWDSVTQSGSGGLAQTEHIRLIRDYMFEQGLLNSDSTVLDGAEKEPIYRGTNSVRFAENYLQEQGITYRKIPYAHTLTKADGSIYEIPFAYLIVETGK